MAEGNLKEVLGELGKVNLEPILTPLLKVSDPVLGALPQASLKSALSRKGAGTSLVEMTERLAPRLPRLIRFMGKLARCRFLMGALALWATVTAPMMKVLAPPVVKILRPISGPVLWFVWVSTKPMRWGLRI